MLHRTRHLCVRQRTPVINAIRAHLAEFGIVAPVGRKGVEELLRKFLEFAVAFGAIWASGDGRPRWPPLPLDPEKMSVRCFEGGTDD